jgi:hypothetical protein
MRRVASTTTAPWSRYISWRLVPSAEDIDRVMADQAELVEVRHILHQAHSL